MRELQLKRFWALVRRWSGLKGWARRAELMVWMGALTACAAAPVANRRATEPTPGPLALQVGENGCLVEPNELLARWEPGGQGCGTWLVLDKKNNRRIGLLSAKSGHTLAEGLAPADCAQGQCNFLSWSTELGPMVVASLNPQSPENPAQYWLGLRNGSRFSFVALTPGDAQAQAGEVVAPRVMLEPWKCGKHLALRRESTAQAELASELVEREGRYLPDGRGWLVVPEVNWEASECRRLPLTF